MAQRPVVRVRPGGGVVAAGRRRARVETPSCATTHRIGSPPTVPPTMRRPFRASRNNWDSALGAGLRHGAAPGQRASGAALGAAERAQVLPVAPRPYSGGSVPLC